MKKTTEDGLKQKDPRREYNGTQFKQKKITLKNMSMKTFMCIVFLTNKQNNTQHIKKVSPRESKRNEIAIEWITETKSSSLARSVALSVCRSCTMASNMQ